MGRLVIAHHKSYHPYKAENIERVRKDEEEARIQEAKEEGRLKLAVRVSKWLFINQNLMIIRTLKHV
jgi:hypothetical protein